MVKSVRPQHPDSSGEPASSWVAQWAVPALLTLIVGLVATQLHLQSSFRIFLAFFVLAFIAAAWVGARQFHWDFWKMALRIYAPGVAIGLVLLALAATNAQQAADIRWYKRTPNNTAQLLTKPDLRLKKTWQHGSVFRIPITLAVARTGSDPLTDVTVQIQYPEGLRVRPTGQQVLNEQSRTLTYKHPLDDLDAKGTYYMLTKPDTLELATRKFGATFNLIDSDGFGPDVQFAALLPGSKSDVAKCMIPDRIPLRVRVYAGGWKVSSATLNLSLPPTGFLEFVAADAHAVRAKGYKLAAAEKILDRILRWPRRYSWTSTGKALPGPVSYQRETRGALTYQLLALGGVPQKIVVDTDGDGDRDIEARARQGKALIEVYPADSTPLRAWTPDLMSTSLKRDCLPKS